MIESNWTILSTLSCWPTRLGSEDWVREREKWKGDRKGNWMIKERPENHFSHKEWKCVQFDFPSRSAKIFPERRKGKKKLPLKRERERERRESVEKERRNILTAKGIIEKDDTFFDAPSPFLVSLFYPKKFIYAQEKFKFLSLFFSIFFFPSSYRLDTLALKKRYLRRKKQIMKENLFLRKKAEKTISLESMSWQTEGSHGHWPDLSYLTLYWSGYESTSSSSSLSFYLFHSLLTFHKTLSSESQKNFGEKQRMKKCEMIKKVKNEINEEKEVKNVYLWEMPTS